MPHQSVDGEARGVVGEGSLADRYGVGTCGQIDFGSERIGGCCWRKGG